MTRRVGDETDPSTRSDPPAERVAPRDHAIGGVWSLVVALAWAALAVWRPTTTFHLAPVLVAAAWPVGLRRGAVLRMAGVDARRGAVGGAAVAVATAVVLAASDLLRGPTLWGSGSVWVEIAPAIVTGAWGGHRFARCGTPGG